MVRHEPEPGSRFFGFDSFIGLPEDWNPKASKGTFSQNGTPPVIPDSRIKFLVGWFQDSVPGFLSSYQPVNRIVIHNDSDLYSSTLYTLTMLNQLITSDTLVIFDEFYDVLHEYRALIDYSTAYKKAFKIVAATHRFLQAAVVFSNQTQIPSE
jgi:O-methyltransferase